MSDISTTADPAPTDPLAPLLADLFDGGLDTERFRALEALVRDDPLARQRYRRYVRLHAALETELLHPQERGPEAGFPIHAQRLAGSANSAPVTRPVSARSGRGWRRSAWILSLLMLVLFGYRFLTQAPDAVVIAVEGVAVITGDLPIVGQPLAARPWSLERGVLRLRLHAGATVVIRAPATFTVTDANALSLTTGTALAEVPPIASGFRITTPTARVTDLGTEFSVQVTPQGGTDIQVRRGHVQVASVSAGPTADVLAGDARSVRSDGVINALRFDATIFAERSASIARVQPTLARLRSDPDLVGLYGGGPQTPGSDRWRLQSASPRAGEAVIAQPAWTMGRFPDSQALAFTRPEDFVRLDIPGNFTALTLWMWVQMQTKGTEPIALCATDGWGTPPILHWLCEPDGRLSLHTYSPSGRIWNWTSERAVPVPSTQWHHLAVTCSDNGLVRFYCDGALLGEQQNRHTVGFSIGAAQIGNWRFFARPGAQRPSGRHLTGAIDEFGILARDLSGAEIRDLVNEGLER